MSGNLLDGNSDGSPGDNYVATFTVASSTTPVLSLPDFARGPGQAVNTNQAGIATAIGLPVSVSQSFGVYSVHFELDYNPALLNITNVALSGTLSGWCSTT